MSDQPRLVPEVESRFFHWKAGTLVLGAKEIDVSADVQMVVRRDLRMGGGRSGVLRMAMNPVRCTVELADGSEVEVQTFRYRDFDGRERMLTMCACCGDVARCDAGDLAVWAKEGCRKCGMSITPVGFLGPCCNWHTFGSCLSCPGATEEAAPLGGLANARAQSGPTNDAGPPATEQRSCPQAACEAYHRSQELRVVPVDQEGVEVRA
jgi:hypothetical protein